MKKVVYWQQILSVKECVDEAEDVIATLDAIKQGEYQRVNLKKLQGSQIPLYRAKINDKARLIFAIIPYKKENTLVLVDILRDHNYENCRFLQESYLKNYLKAIKIEDLREFTDGGFEEVPNVDFSDLTSVITDTQVDSIELQASFRYQHETIILDPAQQELLNSPLPALVEGVAGSGKTCTGFAKILNFGLIEEEQKKKIIYLTMSDKLINQMKDQWMQNIQNPERVDVQFLNYEDFLKNIIDRMDSNYSTVSIKHFQEWLSNHLKINTKFREEGYSIELLLAEARFLSGCKESDYLNYQNLITDRNDKIAFQKLYRSYQDCLQTNHLINIQLNEVRLFEPIADLIIVDESQAFSGAQLQTIRYAAANTQVMYCYDRYQNLYDDTDHLNLFKQDLIRDGQEVTLVRLTRGHRCKQDVADFANNILNLRAYASGKKGVSSSQSRLTILEEDHQTRCAWVSQEDFNHKIKRYFNPDNNNWAVVVPNLDSIPQAKEFYNGHVNIFTEEEIRGLEFDYVILHQLFKDPIFKEMRSKMSAYQTEEKKYMDITDNQRHRFRISLSKLFTAATRSKEFLIIVAESPNRVYQQVLLPSIESKSPIIFDERLTLASTEEEWKELAKNYIKQGLIERAREILKKYSPSIEIDIFIKSIQEGQILELIEQEDSLESQKLDQESSHGVIVNNTMNLLSRDTETISEETPIIAKTSIPRNRKLKLQDVLAIDESSQPQKEKESIVKEYLASEVKSTQDLISLFLTNGKKKGATPKISRLFFKLFENKQNYVKVFSRFCCSLDGMSQYNIFNLIHSIMKSDQSFFNEFISDINNILDNPFYLLEQKIETLDQDLVSRLKAIHALFFILLSQQRIDERPSKKVAQFLLMMDYCLLELSDRSTIQGSLFIEKFPDCFFDDHCWGEYDPYFITSSRDKNSLGHLFFKIKYNNRQIIDSILKANNFTFYKEIYESGQDNNTPTVETYNQGDDYHQTLTSIYFECKFLKMISNDLSDYFKFVSTKEGLQELLIVLRNNNDFINKNIVPKFLDEKQEAVVKKNVLLIYKWFSNCLHDERIWPELYEFLFELKMPFIDKIGVIFDLNQSIKERFFNKDINQLLIQFVVQKHHQSIMKLSSLLQLIHKEGFLTSSLIELFHISKIKNQLLMHELVRVICQNNLTEFDRILINNFEQTKEIFESNFELSSTIMLLNNYELLSILKKYYPKLVFAQSPTASVLNTKLWDDIMIKDFLYSEDEYEDRRVIDLLKQELFDACDNIDFENDFRAACAPGYDGKQLSVYLLRGISDLVAGNTPYYLIQFSCYRRKFKINFNVCSEVLKFSINRSSDNHSSESKLHVFKKIYEFSQKWYRLIDEDFLLSYKTILEEAPDITFKELICSIQEYQFCVNRSQLNPKSKKNWYHEAVKKFRTEDIYSLNSLEIQDIDGRKKTFDINHQDEDNMTPMDLFIKEANDLIGTGRYPCQYLERDSNIIKCLEALIIGGAQRQLPKSTFNMSEISNSLKFILYIKGFLQKPLDEEEMKTLPLTLILLGIEHAVEYFNESILTQIDLYIRDFIVSESLDELMSQKEAFSIVVGRCNDDVLKYLILAFSLNSRAAVEFADLILDQILGSHRSSDLLKQFIELGFLKMEGSENIRTRVKSFIEEKKDANLRSIFQQSIQAITFSASKPIGSEMSANNSDKNHESRPK